MTISSMVLSRDSQEISVLECILGGLQIGVEVETEPAQAWSKLSRSKIDALIVDCDLQGSRGLLRDLQTANFKNSVPLIIVGGSRQTLRPENISTPFVFQKPISVEQAVHTLSAARNIIMDGRLRYHRQRLDIQVLIKLGRRSHGDAYLLNLSQGGIGIRLSQDLPIARSLSVSFSLPGKKRSFSASGEVAWVKPRHSAGIRFTGLSSRSRRDLQIWLEQQYFLH